MTLRLLKSAPAGQAAPARPRRALLAVYAALAALLAGVLWFAIGRPVQVLPRMGRAPAFTLTDERGRWLGAEDLAGRAVLVSFGYSRCGASCAELSRRMADARGALREAGLGGQVALLTISVDPSYDTPAALRRIAPPDEPGAPPWRLLTGAPAEIKEVVGAGFRVYYGPGAAAAPIELEQRAVLIDASGEVRAEYSPEQLEAWRVLRDIELVRREAAGAGWERPVYEAAHLFVCYPQ